jgi:hypothetical protein
LNITVLRDEEDFNEWSPQKSKKRGRSRGKKREQEQERQAKPDDEPDNNRVHYGLYTEEGRNVSEDPGFQIRPDSDAEDNALGIEEREDDSPELRKIDLNKVSVRPRSGPPKGRKSRHKKDESNTSPSVIQPPALVLETSAADLRKTVSAYLTPTSSVQDDFNNT